MQTNIVFVILVLKVALVVKALVVLLVVLEGLAGKVVDGAGNDLRDSVSTSKSRVPMSSARTLSLRSSPIW